MSSIGGAEITYWRQLGVHVLDLDWRPQRSQEDLAVECEPLGIQLHLE